MQPSLPSIRPRRARKSLALVALITVLGACNSTAGPPSADGVTAVSGDAQFATVGTAVANPLVVLVVDQNGSPFGGATVNWTVSSGGGAVSDTTSTSDMDGHATITYTAGATPGTATIVATVAQIWTATFTVYVEAPANSIVPPQTASPLR
jgi:hypothetical protein